MLQRNINLDLGDVTSSSQLDARFPPLLLTGGEDPQQKVPTPQMFNN